MTKRQHRRARQRLQGQRTLHPMAGFPAPKAWLIEWPRRPRRPGRATIRECVRLINEDVLDLALGRRPASGTAAVSWVSLLPADILVREPDLYERNP